ncbi:MAG: prepilin peptidase [Pseudonocardiales bacterium]|nr:prepilin peptidase [Actinomycetota bacterium]
MSELSLFVASMALLGLVIGSFLNVVIYRVPRAESVVSPGSHCPHCLTQIKHRHSVPVLSWLALRGKCAYCRTAISPRYPIVEGATALLFAAITIRFGISAELPAYLYLAAIGVALVVIDVDVRRLPDSIVLPSYIVGALLLLPAGLIHQDWRPAERAGIAMGVLWLLYFTSAVAFPTGVRWDDAKVAGLLGLFLGWLSWPTVLIGALAGLLVIGAGGARLGSTHRTCAVVVPSAACLIVGAVLTLLLTVPIGSWYGSIVQVA